MNVPVSLRRLWVQITADRKRFGVLCAALAVGLLLWGRAIIVTNVPRTAVADPVADAAKEKEAEDAARRAEQRPLRLPRAIVNIDLERTPRRDPFMISGAHFPKAAAPVASGKAFLEVGDDPESAEARRRAALQEHLKQLKLEAVMHGASVVLINGKTYRVGDLIPVPGQADVKFELVKVMERSVAMEHQGRQFVLSMATPGTQERSED